MYPPKPAPVLATAFTLTSRTTHDPGSPKPQRDTPPEAQQTSLAPEGRRPSFCGSLRTQSQRLSSTSQMKHVRNRTGSHWNTCNSETGKADGRSDSKVSS